MCTLPPTFLPPCPSLVTTGDISCRNILTPSPAAGDLAGDGDGQQGEDEELGKSVGEEEAKVHLVWVVEGDEVEGEDGDGEGGDEAVDAGALLGGEDLPPADGGVGEEHREVERDHAVHHIGEVIWAIQG